MFYIRTGLLCLLVCLQTLLFSQTPNDFLGYRLGDQFTPHHRLVEYFKMLAQLAPDRMMLSQYGTTNEGRPLYLAFFSSPENLKRLDQIQLNNLRLAGMIEGKADLGKAVPIVWLSMSVHGNEPSGSEASMALAHRLLTDNQAQEWLKNTLVILDPSVNPDGYDRYTHWNRMVQNKRTTAQPDSREHREPWPGGRVNHYYFDLNRDWAWATQAETQQRIVQYQMWLPQVHADLHEQGIDNPYYFAPAAEPMHDYITPWQREFQATIGRNHAQYFDAAGWMYFTKEVFDLFYPSYGDTYPMYNGAIGMTYEQAGNSSAGVAIRISNGDTLTLRDRIAHHLTTSLSTIEITSKNASKVLENFRAFYTNTSAQPQGPYKAFVIRDINNYNKINDLCRWLDLHKIKYGRAGANASVKAFDYSSGKEIAATIQPNDVVISAYQPKSTFLQILFEPESRLSDSLTYDITAWSLPYAWGLEAYALKDRLEPRKKFEPFRTPEVMLAASPYSWCVHRNALAEAKFLSDILQKGVKVRYATRDFAIADQQFAPGALVINRGDNRLIAADLDGIIKNAAARHNVALHPIFTGYAGKGNDLGSDAFQLIDAPKVALVYGDDVDENSFGHTWYFFEQELDYPLAQIQMSRLGRINLNAYNTLIFPNGYYNISDADLKVISDWVRLGGRLIAFDGGARAFADKDGWPLKSKAAAAEKDSSANKPKPYTTGERERVSEQLPGAIIKAQSDPTHPLGYGMGNYYFTLKTGAEAFEMPEKAAAAIYIGDQIQAYGFIGSKVKPRLKNNPIAVTQRMGSGEIVLIVDNPLFRCFWQQGKVLFSNALFF
jgi:hypothetical protein